jgi:hypothetical protein
MEIVHRQNSRPYFERHMRKKKDTIVSPPIKHEVRTCCAFEGAFGRGRSVAQNKRFFFAWKDGCLMGTFDSIGEATESLGSGQRRRTI